MNPPTTAGAPSGRLKPPLVTIGIPTFNRARFLKRMLPQVSNQTYRNLEILISDNASEDETQALCSEWASRDSRIRLLRHPKNIGLYPNHNACLEAARGRYLCLFHDDEQYTPEMIDRYVAFMEAHPEAGLLCSDWELIDEADRVVAVRQAEAPPLQTGDAYVAQTTRSGRSSLNCPGTMIRREALNGIRFDPESPLGFGDFIVWFRIAERWSIGHLGERLWRYRIHSEALSDRSILEMARDFQTAVGSYLDRLEQADPRGAARAKCFRENVRRYLFWSLIYELCRHGRPGKRRGQTIFDMGSYRLSPVEVQEAWVLLESLRRGWGERLLFGLLELISQTPAIGGLARLLQAAPNRWMRRLLGLR